MLRDWNSEYPSKDEDFAPREQDDPPNVDPTTIGQFREWPLLAAPKTHQEVQHELVSDPLASPSESIVSGLSMPVFADVGAVQNPFDDETSKRQQSIPSFSEAIESGFDNNDVEACQDLHLTYANGTRSIDQYNTNRSSFSSALCQKLTEIRSNPAAKFKLMVVTSLFIVIVCIFAIAGASSSSHPSAGSGDFNPSKGSGIATSFGVGIVLPEMKQPDTNISTPTPTLSGLDTLQIAPSKLTDLPTFYPTEIPTYSQDILYTNVPTSLFIDVSSSAPTSPSTTAMPLTISPTMDCSDSRGSYLTYNNKLHDCAWLDNDSNGDKSDRKNENCLSSDLGDKCRYTCRLYNGCMHNLLSKVDTFSNENDISIGDACVDKEGTFMGNNHIPRNCSWIEEDPLTAPMKKNLNCGTPDEPRTELGTMCPGSCAGYNTCGKVGEIRVDEGSNDDQEYDNDGIISTLAPISDEVNTDLISDMTLYFGNSCSDALGEFQTHVGPAHFRQCRWFNRDGDGLTVSDKIRLNCHITEIGMNCLKTCGCYGDRNNGDVNDDDDDMVVPTLTPTTQSSSDLPTYFSTMESSKQICDDEEGEFQTHVGASHFRQCRWFNRDGDGLTIDDKIKLNCHITEIGMKCLGTCGCLGESSAWEVVDKSGDRCKDPIGPFETHESDEFRQCDWLDTENSIEKKELNCGLTELGNACICRCAPFMQGHNPSQNVVVQDVSWEFGKGWDFSKVTAKPSDSPSQLPKEYEGRFDDTGKLLLLKPYADATVAQIDTKTNYGDTSILRVGSSNNKMQSLLLFDLSFVAKSFGSTFAKAYLRLYVTEGSSIGGLTFKQMDDTSWKENKVTWSNVPGGDGSDELILSFLYNIIGDTWYDVDVTEAARDAIERGKQYMSIRIASDDCEVSFASKERDDAYPLLIIDSKTIAPSLFSRFPTMSPVEPTEPPSSSPVLPLDCYDHKGKFRTESGERQSCSWFDVGDGASKKKLNCVGNAKMFCQAQCSEYNGCDEMTCEDRTGSYVTHTGWTAECSWLTNGRGALKLEQNCGTDKYPITELGKRCQATCGDYNGCNINTSEPTPNSESLLTASLSPSTPHDGTSGAPSSSPVVPLDCIDRQGKFKTSSGERQTCSWFDHGNAALKKEMNCQRDRDAMLFCQSQCGNYNGCDEITCEDRAGSYSTDSGWRAECSWLISEPGTLKLEQNCGTDKYPITELGKRCQATCGDYNGCNKS